MSKLVPHRALTMPPALAEHSQCAGLTYPQVVHPHITGRKVHQARLLQA